MTLGSNASKYFYQIQNLVLRKTTHWKLKSIHLSFYLRVANKFYKFGKKRGLFEIVPFFLPNYFSRARCKMQNPNKRIVIHAVDHYKWQHINNTIRIGPELENGKESSECRKLFNFSVESICNRNEKGRN